jgi:hypothetical protein
VTGLREGGGALTVFSRPQLTQAPRKNVAKKSSTTTTNVVRSAPELSQTEVRNIVLVCCVVYGLCHVCVCVCVCVYTCVCSMCVCILLIPCSFVFVLVYQRLMDELFEGHVKVDSVSIEQAQQKVTVVEVAKFEFQDRLNDVRKAATVWTEQDVQLLKTVCDNDWNFRKLIFCFSDIVVSNFFFFLFNISYVGPIQTQIGTKREWPLNCSKTPRTKTKFAKKGTV